MGEPSEQIQDQRRIWDTWGQADPLWAVLSDPGQKGGRWSVEEFFASGRADIAQLVEELNGQGLAFRTGRCLDFGCGVGRLTQALGNVFENCDGVDISDAMVESARKYNEHGTRCRYHVNIADDLALFPDGSFDFVYSTLVLQHNPPAIAAGYIKEFMRVLGPGGLAVFDMPAAFLDRRIPAEGHRAQIRLVSAPGAFRAGSTADIQVTVVNVSGQDWPAGAAVQVGNHWRTQDGVLVTLDDGRTPIGDGLADGQSVTLSVAVTAPSTRGRYVLDVDLVEEGVCWFADRGSSTASKPVTVEAVPIRARRGRLFGRPGRPNADAPAEPEPFTMNALPRERVEACVLAAGGRVEYVRRSDSAGLDWETYRYFVVREPASSVPGT